MSDREWHKFGGEYGMGSRVYTGLRTHLWMDFVVVDIVTESTGERGETIEEYFATPERVVESLTSDVEKASPQMSGYIKWDGCCGITIHEDHLCGRGDAEEFCAVVMHLFDEAKRLMPEHVEAGGGL